MKISIEDAITLLHETAYGSLATHSVHLPGYPYATAVPYVTDEAHRPVVCISALAEHTKNLLADPKVSLSVLQPGAADVQAAPRLTFVGDAERFELTPEFLARYLRYEPGTRQLLPLDFMFIRLKPAQVRFIEGIGRMGWLENDDWNALPQLPARDEANLVCEVSSVARAGVSVLGIDCYGIDYRVNGRRERQRFPNGPLVAGTIEKAALNLAPKLD